MNKKVIVGMGVVAGITALVFAAKGHAGTLEYCCPYGDNLCFATYEELVTHVQTVHPGERIPLPIEWD